MLRRRAARRDVSEDASVETVETKATDMHLSPGGPAGFHCCVWQGVRGAGAPTAVWCWGPHRRPPLYDAE